MLFAIEHAILMIAPRQFCQGWPVGHRGLGSEVLRIYASAMGEFASSLGFDPADLPRFCLDDALPDGPPRNGNDIVVGSVGWAIPRLASLAASIRLGGSAWAETVAPSGRRVVGGLLARFSMLLGRRAEFLRGFTGPSVRDEDDPLESADIVDPRDLFPSATPEMAGQIREEWHLIYRSARLQFRSMVLDRDYPPNVAGALLVERIETMFMVRTDETDRCGLASRWHMQATRAAIDHELKGSPLDLDGNLFDPDDFGDPIGAEL